MVTSLLFSKIFRKLKKTILLNWFYNMKSLWKTILIKCSWKSNTPGCGANPDNNSVRWNFEDLVLFLDRSYQLLPDNVNFIFVWRVLSEKI